MKIEVAEREVDGILSFKPETQAERIQLEWVLKKAQALHLDAFNFTGWDDDGGGISFVVRLLPDFQKIGNIK